MPYPPQGVVIKHAQLPDVSTPHALADLVDAVCSETEADNKIAAAVGLSALLPDDTLRNSNDDERDVTALTYTKVKEVLLNADLPACRIKYSTQPHFSSKYVWSKIYKNGNPIGTEHSAATSAFTTWSEDFSGFVSGDLIQIYAYGEVNDSLYGIIKDMRFYYAVYITSLASVDLLIDIASDYFPAISMTNQDP